MTVAPPDTDAPRPTAVAECDDRCAQSGGAGADAFAALLAVAQSGLGQRAGSIAPRLHHRSPPLSGDTADARHQRLEQMTESDREARTGRPSSRLQGSSGPHAGGLGPRTQRLALERQDLAEQTTRQTPDPAGVGKQGRAKQGSVKNSTPAPPAVSIQEAEARPAPVAGKATTEVPTGARRPDQVPTGQLTATASRPPSDTPASPVNARAVSPVQAPPVAEPTGPAAVRPAAQTQNVAAQVARVLTAPNTGADGPRAVTGVEQTAAARGMTGSTTAGQSAAASGRGTAKPSPNTQPPDTRAAESTQRSDFDRLVRSVRLNVGATRSTARVRLEPPELGRIQIEARLDGQRVELLVRTETSAAGELLRARVAELQAALEQHGLRIERFEINPAAPAEEQNPRDGNATGRGEDTNQPATDQDAEHGPTGGDPEPGAAGDEAVANTARLTGANDQSDGTGEGQSSAGEQPTLAAPGAAVETRLDVKV